MKTVSLFRKWSVVLMTVALLISLFAIPAFAEETTATPTVAETTAAETTAETTAQTTAATLGGNTTGDNNADKKDGLGTGAIIGIVIAGVIVVALVILCIKFRENIKKFLRVYKSEAKKIVWLSWDQTKKNTWVVLVVLVLCALAICLIDFGLSKGFLAFIDLFKKA